MRRVLARATEPFYTTKGVGKGTGLGLSMVHGLAGQSGGALQLRSRPGEGTCIDLWIPVADKAVVVKGASAPTREWGAPPRAARSLSILVVDDDPLVLMGTAAMLEDLGHQVIAAGSGAEAIAALDGGFDAELVITDYAMPQMTGLELAWLLKERAPALPVILASGYAESLSGDAGELPLPRLAKPYLQGDLQRAISESTSSEEFDPTLVIGRSDVRPAAAGLK
jgi:CheY-like chemotaxis protein